MAPYGKVFDSIFGSSIMEKELETRYIWMCMIITADKEGFVDETIPALARRFNVGIEGMERAIKCFLEPDPTSRTPDKDGRRIEPIRESFGWHIINYDHYRNLREDEQRREYMREYMRKYREDQKKEEPLTPVNNGKQQLANTDTDTDTDTDTKKRKKEKKTAFRGNVLLTEKEHETLIEKHGEQKTKWILDKLSLAKETHGYKYESDYGAINSWVLKAWEKEGGQVSEGDNQPPLYGSPKWKERYPEG